MPARKTRLLYVASLPPMSEPESRMMTLRMCAARVMVGVSDGPQGGQSAANLPIWSAYIGLTGTSLPGQPARVGPNGGIVVLDALRNTEVQ